MFLGFVRDLAAERRDGRTSGSTASRRWLCELHRTADNARVFASPTTGPASNSRAGIRDRELTETIACSELAFTERD